MKKQFKVYKSSAGSGKTYTLVKSYLSICLQHSEPYYYSKILAITFTNKAAQEMKERVLHTLGAFSSDKPLEGGAKSMANDLMAELSLSEEKLRRKSSDILSSILHNYADFNISTIDKFSHQLIRTFAKDLNLDLNFKVDLDEDDLLKIIIFQLTEKVGRDQDITRVLVYHTLMAVDQGKSWDPSSDLFQIAKQLLNEEALPKVEELKSFTPTEALQLQTKLYEQNRAFEEDCFSLAEDALALIASIHLDRSCFYSSGSLITYFEKLRSLDFEKLENKKTAQKSVHEEKWSSGKADASDKAAIESIASRLTAFFVKSEKLLDGALRKYRSNLLIAKSLGLLSLIKAIEEAFNHLKREKSILPISDFNKKINEVVSNEPMPFIYERLGERFSHIMIDEFQDTSVMQFLNLMPLIEESLSRGEFNMIVGDAKQAIYRFRGGKVEQFAQMPNYLPKEFENNAIVNQRLETLKANYENIQLGFNFRSAEHIVKFNNVFFDNVKKLIPESVKLVLDEHQQTPFNKNGRGYVEVSMVKEKYAEGVDRHLQLTLANIEASLKDGYAYGDMAILCRTKAIATKVAEYLNDHQVPILSSESLLIANSPNVQLIMNFARYVMEPISSHAKTVIELYYSQLTSDAKLNHEFEKLRSNQFDLKPFLDEHQIKLDLEEIKSFALYEIFEKCIRAFRLDQEMDVYLRFFMEQVFQFQQNTSIVLEEFIDWFDQKSEVLSIEMNGHMNSVQIMTIHKSKGLEFPIVILPFADYDITPRNPSYLWLDPQLANIELNAGIGVYSKVMKQSLFADDYKIEEEKRIMDLVNQTYVAFTRPSERLYLISDKLSSTKEVYSLPHFLAKAKPDDATELEDGYAYGHQAPCESSHEEEETSSARLKYLSNDWKNRIKIASVSKPDSKFEAVKFGNLYHELMRDVLVQEDVKNVIESAKLRGQVNEEQLGELEKCLELTVNHPELKTLFAADNIKHMERSFLTAEGEIRPDRVVEMDEEVIILDYKTGQASTQDEIQINHYVHSLSEVYDKPISAKLFYLKDNKVVNV